jgi:phosphatidylserine decarboxylase
MSASQPIIFYNRHTQQLETEVVYGEDFLRWVYENPLGKVALHTLVKRAVFSSWYGSRMDNPASAAKIAPFIATYGLNPDDFAESVASYGSFNDFFYRKLKPSARPIDADPCSVVFPADGRHLLIEDIAACDSFFIKGMHFDLGELLGDEALARRYAKGSMLISRLCPVDYHRFHFPCDGISSAPVLLNGPLYSVSPIALKQRPSILWENKRCLTHISTPSLGEVLFLEIGATCVGSIVHTAVSNALLSKGAEKGYFRFGGSCVITLYEPGRVVWDADLIEHGKAGREVYAWMGERAGLLQ